jgi:hypothetical protein
MNKDKMNMATEEDGDVQMVRRETESEKFDRLVGAALAKASVRNSILDQLARTTLLPGEMAAAILAGDVPPMKEIVDALLIGSLDCHATVVGDSGSTMNERRIARACATAAFLSALATTN